MLFQNFMPSERPEVDFSILSFSFNIRLLHKWGILHLTPIKEHLKNFLRGAAHTHVAMDNVKLTLYFKPPFNEAISWIENRNYLFLAMF